MKNFIPVLILLLIMSCKPVENLSFYHKNSLKIFNDEIDIKIIPIRKKNSATVKGKYFITKIERKSSPHSIKIKEHRKVKLNKVISLQKYDSLVEKFHKIDLELLKFPKYGKDENGRDYIEFGPLDSGTNTLNFQKNGNKIEYNTQGITSKYGTYFEIVESILKIADLKVNDAN